ncbi:MAG TPA: hypothetical protein VNY52_03630 [Solirubrobacteraceae bacterium]|nr:hypothetical protein [Solirubrobacteraceae bacterium]
MVARRIVLMAVASLCSFAAGALVAAPGALAAESCPNEASRQGPSVSLPQCRVYEQVTPGDKGDAIDLFQTLGLIPIPNDAAFAAEDGNELLLKAESSIGPSAPSGVAAYVFSRGVGGWSMRVVAPAVQEQLVEPEVFDPVDLSTVGFVDQVGSGANLFAGNPSAWSRTNLVGPAGGPYTSLFSLSGEAAYSEEGRQLVGGSRDLSKVILETQDHSLTPSAEGQVEGSEALYESSGGGECASGTSNCRLVNVNNEGKLLTCGARLGQGETGFGGAHSAVSSGGSKVFFTAPDPGAGGLSAEKPEGPGCWNPGAGPQENPPQLYMREDGARTVEISAPEAGVEVGTAENPLAPAVFVGASSDGSKVFFLTGMELTKDDTGHALELYEYETITGKLTRISHGESGDAVGEVHFVGAISSDGSAAYFTAYGKLAAGASALPQSEAFFSSVNLYRYDTLTGATTFITTLNEDDYPLSVRGFSGSWYGGIEHELASEKEWYTTGNGQFLVFGTNRPITGFDNLGAPGVECMNAYPGGSAPPQCLELYRYNAKAAEDKEPSLVCVSCAGGAPVDDALFARTTFQSPASGPPRPISENGEDVFFDSASALVPQATPGKVHVYEWHDETLSLISSPGDPNNAFFLGSSADGRDVFFSTHAQLSPQDTDQSDDIYDARVDGGFAGLTPLQCTGTGCQGVPAAAPIFATPASVTFEGVGNFPPSQPVVEPSTKPKSKSKSKPKKCGRGFVKKRGRCVKQQAKKSAKGRK